MITHLYGFNEVSINRYYADVMVPFSAIWAATKERDQTDEEQRGCAGMQVFQRQRSGFWQFQSSFPEIFEIFRNKKKEYIKCLENRVAVLENQNKVTHNFSINTRTCDLIICISGAYRGVKKSKRTLYWTEKLTAHYFDL